LKKLSTINKLMSEPTGKMEDVDRRGRREEVILPVL
jgi:hypothetical protein